jgi:hypothetical protein
MEPWPRRKGWAAMRFDETEGVRIWKDSEGKLWTLADSNIDTEMFELIGDPVYNEAAELWCQQIQMRTD